MTEIFSLEQKQQQTLRSLASCRFAIFDCWGSGLAFTFFGQLVSRRARSVDPQVDQVPQTADAD